ncbi:MAG: peptidoglycan binding domain-containing protein [Clostridiales bacterium]|nr:peptidoglycan binding domain-containing protein [Clostridiales bacterium]
MQNKKKLAGLIVIILLTIIAVVYVAFAAFFRSHFSFGTSIDGIPVGGYGIEKVEELIRREVEDYSLRLVMREGASEEISGNSISLTPVFQGEIEQLLEEQNGFSWVMTWIQKKDLELDRVVTYDEGQLEQSIKQLSCMKKENQREPVNAGVSEYSKEEGYSLVPADYGTTLDEDTLLNAVTEAIMVLADELVLEDAGCYQNPEILDDDANLLAAIEKMKQYVNTIINYDFGEKSECLDGSIIHTWLSEEGGEVSIDREAVEEYVKELGKKYNTAYQPKNFKTSYGTTITISNGFYGWRIDREGEVEQILADLESGGMLNREPVYSQRANSHGETDYGDSYVEINLTAQHLFLYKDGALVVESDFVSGNVSKGNGTPAGAYGLTYKTTDAVLRGADYETPVKYWMPFAGDVGMHDATWRRQFGGNIYKTNGSHGCINLPLSVAETIYKNVEKGYAVLVYELPGTESKAVQQQDAATIVNMINTIGVVTLESEPVITGARNLYNVLPDSAKGYVTNYDVLVAAEAALAVLKNGGQPADQSQSVDQSQPAEQQPADQSQPVDQSQPAEQTP